MYISPASCEQTEFFCTATAELISLLAYVALHYCTIFGICIDNKEFSRGWSTVTDTRIVVITQVHFDAFP